MRQLEAEDHPEIFVPHDFAEHLVDLGEIRMNYAVAGSSTSPALLLIPSQTESWWGYEEVMRELSPGYQVFAVDLRGQGRSTWTPGRYTLDNFGNDLVRFLDMVVGRPAFVSGLSSGGVLTAWLAAYAKPGQLKAAVLEDPPLFASELVPAVGQSIEQAMAPRFRVQNKYLGDQWSIGDYGKMLAALGREVPKALQDGVAQMSSGEEAATDIIPQNLKEYDPEWARVFASGQVAASCSHQTMVEQIRVPILFTHHFHHIDEETGRLLGAISDLQVDAVRRAVEGAGQPFRYLSFPSMPHSMHRADPKTFASILDDWFSEQPEGKR